jgi:DNA-binding XRE family transcriptional regulator
MQCRYPTCTCTQNLLSLPPASCRCTLLEGRVPSRFGQLALRQRRANNDKILLVYVMGQAVGMTQAEVAKALGRHQPFIANIESRQRRLDLIELIDLAAIIDIDIEALIREL